MVFIIFYRSWGKATSIFHSADTNKISVLAPPSGTLTNTGEQATRELADLWHPGWALMFGSDVVHWLVGVAAVLGLTDPLTTPSRIAGAGVSDIGVHWVLLLRLGHKRSWRVPGPAGEVVHGSIAYVFPAASAAAAAAATAAGVQPVKLPPLLEALNLTDGPRVPPGRPAGTGPQPVGLLAVQHGQRFALVVQKAQFGVDSPRRSRLVAIRPPFALGSLDRRPSPLFMLQDGFLTLVRRPLRGFLPELSVKNPVLTAVQVTGEVSASPWQRRCCFLCGMRRDVRQNIDIINNS